MMASVPRRSAAEREFLSTYDPRAFPAVAVTVDLAILSVVSGELSVLLVRRGTAPYVGQWALPGGFGGEKEELDDAAALEMREETGVVADAQLEQLRCYGTPGRDPRMRVVSVAYVAFVAEPPEPAAGTDA